MDDKRKIVSLHKGWVRLEELMSKEGISRSTCYRRLNEGLYESQRFDDGMRYRRVSSGETLPEVQSESAKSSPTFQEVSLRHETLGHGLVAALLREERERSDRRQVELMAVREELARTQADLVHVTRERDALRRVVETQRRGWWGVLKSWCHRQWWYGWRER